MSRNGKSKYYSFIAGERISSQFWAHSQIGKGAYGTVIKAYNYRQGYDVALKIFKSGNTFKKIGVEEALILDIIHEYNTNKRYPIITHFGTMMWMGHFCIIYPLYNYNLYYTMKKNKSVGFNIDAVQKIAGQLLECLFFLQHPNLQIIHTDIKPDNVILVNSRSYDIKLIDFGSYQRNPPKKNEFLVQTVYYRSPEVILMHKYSFPIDIWSLGCLLFELITGKILFNETNDDEIIKSIIEVLGIPPTDMLFTSPVTDRWFEFNNDNSTIPTLKNYNRLPPGYRTIKSMYEYFLPNYSNYPCVKQQLLLDLINKMIIYNPMERITPLQALRHPFINSREKYNYYIHKINQSSRISSSGKFGESRSQSDDHLECRIQPTDVKQTQYENGEITKNEFKSNAEESEIGPLVDACRKISIGKNNTIQE